MARCSCGNATCSCVITAGDGVTVIGNGSPTRPYEIAIDSANQNIKDVLQVTDTPTLDLVMVGSGTTSDKVTIYGQTLTKMSDLRDVSDPEGPQTGDVPIWQASGHWEFRQLPSGPPTTVQVSDGLTGDGSSGTPVKVRFPPLPLAFPPYPPLSQVVGVHADLTLQNYGWPILKDEVGNLRTPPFVITGDDTTKWNNATPMSSYPSGVSVLTISTTAAAPGGWPSGSATILTVKRFDNIGANGSGYQIWFQSTNSDSLVKTLIRTAFPTTNNWSAWSQIGGLYNGSAAASVTTDLTTTAVVDVVGATLTVPVQGTDSVYLVTGTFDVAAYAATGSGYLLGRLNVAGVLDNKQLIWLPSATAGGPRMLMSQTWRVTGQAAGNVVFKLQASTNVASVLRLQSLHTAITVEQVA